MYFSYYLETLNQKLLVKGFQLVLKLKVAYISKQRLEGRLEQ